MREPRRRGYSVFPLSRGGIIGLVCATGAVLVAGGLAAVTYLGTGSGTVAHPSASVATSGGNVGVADGADSASSAQLPELAANPQVAVMPKSAARTSASPEASSGHSAASASPAAPASSPAASASSPTASAVAPGSTSCTNPQFQTSAQYGMWNLSPYFVYNDMWGISGYNVTQTLYACSYSNWYVVADMNNDNGDGHVKTYPNAQRDFNDPQISSLQSVTSTFAETSPHTGIYEDAYDIWLNGIATSGSSEVMIWTENYHQVPAGSPQVTVTLDGRSYTVWRNGQYFAFVANTNFTSATMNLLAFFQWLLSKGWIPGNSTLSQVCYGAELVSTNGVPATFSFTNFSATAS